MIFFEIIHAAENMAFEDASSPVAAFGINLKLFLAQLVNFLIVLVVLWKWVYTPLVRKMNERTEKISKGLSDAAAATEKLKHAESEMNRLIRAGKQEAQSILAQEQKDAIEVQARFLEETQLKQATLVEQAKAVLEQEKMKMISDAKREVAELVVAATEKILGKVVNEQVDKKLVEEAVKELKLTSLI